MSRSRHLNRVAIFLKTQNPATEQSLHSASRTFAATLEGLQLIRFLNKERSAAQLRTSESWQALKARVRGAASGVVIVKLLPPLDYYGAALAPYPPAPRNERERSSQRKRWMTAEKF